MEQTKQTAKQRYYEKNKEMYKERVRLQREEKKAKQQIIIPPPTQIIKEVVDSPITCVRPIRAIKIPFPALDFLIWSKRMTYVTVDIRDTTGEFVWNGLSKLIKEKISPIQILTKTESINENNKYIDCIKRLLKVGERYAMEVPLANLNIPVFFYIKEINKENIIMEYVDIHFIKRGTGEAIIDPAWEAIKEERLIIENKDIANIYPYDEKKKYEYESYCHIRNDVRTFYGIVNRRN
jgi:hypothetical protein